MPAPLAIVADIEARGVTVPLEDSAKFEYLLRLGAALLRLRFTTLDARIASGDLDAALVADVLVAMVLRAPVVTNPERVRSESVSPDTYSVTYDGSAGGDELELTAQEVALLAPREEPAPLFGSARLKATLS